MAITEETREEDERLRAELRCLDLERLKKLLKSLVAKPKQIRDDSVAKAQSSKQR